MYIRRSKDDFLKPVNIFSLTMLSTFTIASLSLSGLQGGYSFGFAALIYISLLAFNIGSRVVQISKKNILKTNYYDKNKFLISFYGILILVLFSFIYTWLKLGPPPLISGADRTTYYLPLIERLYLLIYLLSFLLFFDKFSSTDKGIVFLQLKANNCSV